MAKVVTITNPVTGQPAQVDQLDHTAQQIDDAVEAARWSHRNLLDNAYFANPDAIIDQRGGYVVPPNTPYYSDTALSTQAGTVSAYTMAKPGNGTYGTITVGSTTYYVAWSAAVRGYTGAGYGIDRWIRRGGDTLLNDGYITLLGRGNNLDQITDKYVYKQLRGKIVTVSVLGRGNLSIVSEDYTNSYKAKYVNSGEFTIGSLVLTVRSDADRLIFHIQPQDGNPCDIIAVKLELGTVQTLAHQDADGNWVLNDPPPDKGMELLKCQRYFWRSWTGERNTQKSILGVVFGNGRRITGFDYPVEMRTKPSITVYGLTGAGKVTDWVSDADYGPASPAYWDTQRCVALACDEAGLSNDNRVYYFIEANAEL